MITCISYNKTKIKFRKTGSHPLATNNEQSLHVFKKKCGHNNILLPMYQIILGYEISYKNIYMKTVWNCLPIHNFCHSKANSYAKFTCDIDWNTWLVGQQVSVISMMLVFCILNSMVKIKLQLLSWVESNITQNWF